MKKYSAVGVILILFAAFAFFVYCKQSYTPVLKVINPVTIQVDLNNNGRYDDGETVCITDTETFSLDKTNSVPDFAKDFKLSINDITNLGYMADNFANNTLINNPVKVEFTGIQTPVCKFAEIYLHNEKYSEILKNSGFAAVNGNFSEENFKEKLKYARQQDLVILNLKSNKYHKLDCKYGLLSSDFSVIPRKQVPKDATPCKFCHVKTPEKKSFRLPEISFKKQNFTCADGKIRLILADFTMKLKPDRTCTEKACIELVNEIDKAENSIDMAVYGMNLIPKLYDALHNAKFRGVKIRIVYDKSSSPDKDYYTETSEYLKLADELKSDYLPDKPNFSNKIMHNKFIIIDNKTVFTGSMNLSASGLSGYNSDAVVIINSYEIAKLYTAEFEQMLSGKFHELKTKPQLTNDFTLDGTKISIYFSPYDRASEKIIPIIDNARKYIYVPAYLITHQGITSALIRAKQRNIDVKIIIDTNSTSTRNTKYLMLRQNKIPVKTENYAGKLHSKSMIIDDKYVITGSMNFSNSGENKNDENVLIIENPKLAKEYKEFFTYLWSKIPDIYLTQNARAESKDSIGSCTDGIDNDFDGLIDAKDPGCR